MIGIRQRYSIYVIENMTSKHTNWFLYFLLNEFKIYIPGTGNEIKVTIFLITDLLKFEILSIDILFAVKKKYEIDKQIILYLSILNLTVLLYKKNSL